MSDTNRTLLAILKELQDLNRYNLDKEREERINSVRKVDTRSTTNSFDEKAFAKNIESIFKNASTGMVDAMKKEFVSSFKMLNTRLSDSLAKLTSDLSEETVKEIDKAIRSVVRKSGKDELKGTIDALKDTVSDSAKKTDEMKALYSDGIDRYTELEKSIKQLNASVLKAADDSELEELSNALDSLESEFEEVYRELSSMDIKASLQSLLDESKRLADNFEDFSGVEYSDKFDDILQELEDGGIDSKTEDELLKYLKAAQRRHDNLINTIQKSSETAAKLMADRYKTLTDGFGKMLDGVKMMFGKVASAYQVTVSAGRTTDIVREGGSLSTSILSTGFEYGVTEPELARYNRLYSGMLSEFGGNNRLANFAAAQDALDASNAESKLGLIGKESLEFVTTLATAGRVVRGIDFQPKTLNKFIDAIEDASKYSDITAANVSEFAASLSKSDSALRTWYEAVRKGRDPILELAKVSKDTARSLYIEFTDLVRIMGEYSDSIDKQSNADRYVKSVKTQVLLNYAERMDSNLMGGIRDSLLGNDAIREQYGDKLSGMKTSKDVKGFIMRGDRGQLSDPNDIALYKLMMGGLSERISEMKQKLAVEQPNNFAMSEILTNFAGETTLAGNFAQDARSMYNRAISGEGKQAADNKATIVDKLLVGIDDLINSLKNSMFGAAVSAFASSVGVFALSVVKFALMSAGGSMLDMFGGGKGGKSGKGGKGARLKNMLGGIKGGLGKMAKFAGPALALGTGLFSGAEDAYAAEGGYNKTTAFGEGVFDGLAKGVAFIPDLFLDGAIAKTLDETNTTGAIGSFLGTKAYDMVSYVTGRDSGLGLVNKPSAQKKEVFVPLAIPAPQELMDDSINSGEDKKKDSTRIDLGGTKVDVNVTGKGGYIELPAGVNPADSAKVVEAIKEQTNNIVSEMEKTRNVVSSRIVLENRLFYSTFFKVT